MCVICGASAHYRHYGVIACERCYKFYRGAIFKQENLTRAENCTGTCDINESTRNNCHSCRFLKCQEQGMKIPKDKLRSRYNLVFKEYWVLVDMYYVVFFFFLFFSFFAQRETLSHWNQFTARYNFSITILCILQKSSVILNKNGEFIKQVQKLEFLLKWPILLHNSIFEII